MKKKILSIVIVLGIILGIIFSISLYAGTGKLYTNLTAADPAGVGYGMGNPQAQGGKYIWHMSTYNSLDGKLSDVQKDIYCLQADYGASWETVKDNATSIIEYNMVFDLQEDRENVSSKMTVNSNDEGGVVQNILDENGEHYTPLLWLLDNMYIKGEDITKYLEWAGMSYNEYYGQYYNVNTGEMYGSKLLLTEADIIAIQRMAIWTITNGGDYDKTAAGLTQWLYITEDYCATYSAMSTKDKKRNTQAIDLYNYLVDSAREGASLYTAENNYTTTDVPVAVDTSKSIVETTKLNTNYCLIGPIVINKNNDSLYTITLTLTDKKGNEITPTNYSFTDKNGSLLENMTLKDLVGNTNGFYIKLPRTSAEEVNIKIDITHSVTNKNLWLAGTETTNEIQLDAEQPIGEISREPETVTTQFTTGLKQFDLALRKYITAVNGTNVVNTRVPQIDTDTLLTETTASYNHKKDPVVVKNGDIVTYKITIYNEGELNGYASEIIDQLPEGLKYAGNSTITSNKNTYSVNYNETSNKITFTNTTKESLNKYGTNSLDNETLEFRCEVITTPDKVNDKILTNVAWISGAYDSESKLEITEVGDDRDSRPQISPNVTSTDIEDFKGNSSNKNDLTDSIYHYEGEQDDDDFEKLVLEPEIEITVTKEWDDNNNQDGLRPEEVEVSLYANGTAVEGKTAILNDSNDWEYTFTKLPLKSNGTNITYSVEETSQVTGYITTPSGSADTGFTITNTHTPEVINIPVTKIWEDSNNQDGIRPETITVNLKNGNTKVETIVLNESNSWTHTFSNLPKKSNGTDINYTVEEISVEGYKTEVTGDKGTGYTITNTYTPELINIPVTKVWEDSNNQDGIRPDSITVNLKNGDTTVETITLNKANSWTHTFSNLPKKSNGTDINYTIEEISVEGYETKVTGDKGTGYTITNTHTPEVIDIPVTKVWKDSNDQDGIRPDSITVNLKNGKTTVDTIALNEANSWTHTFRGLPKKSNGNEINYTIEEVSVNGYTSETTGDKSTGYIVTNTHIPGTKEVEVTKTWEDNQNQDGIRPQSIIIELLANGVTTEKTLILSESNNWTDKFTQLPEYEDGVKLNYTVKEISVDGYESQITGNMDEGYEITNTHIPEVTSVKITKVWNDANNQDGKRPTEITITLFANNQEVDGQSVKLNNTIGWEYTFTNLPKYKNGQEISYTVEETGIPQGYTSETTGNMQDGYTITNTYTPEVINIPVTKIWEDNNNQDGLRPTEITVQLYANEVAVDGKILTLKTDNSWTQTFENLPKYKAGEIIEYTVKEAGVPTGYTSLISGSMNTGYTITNTYTPGLTSVKVTKVWNDNNNQDGIRPESVNVSLLADNEEVQKIDLNESNNWEYIFTNLPIKKDGQDIEYTIVENTQIDGYTTTITSNNLNAARGVTQKALIPEFIITNTHETDEISITVNKEWQDENNYDGIRPTSVVVNIKNGETIVDTVTLSDENNWTHTFENLPAKENGTDINYTIEEIEPEGYTANIVDNGDNTYTITNTHIPEKIFDLALRKYIIKINNNELSTLGLQTRVPNISETSLKNGTTANYRHRKEPVQVEENDIITYAITIYNEGEKTGYASQIIDQLPTGLIYNPSTTVISKDVNGADKNTYTVEYESSTNKVTFNILNTAENPAKELLPYEEGNLDSETIEIKCKVVYKAVAGEKNILTNVAWINEAYDTEENKPITQVGDDRDSEPGTKPNVNKDNMEDYKGNESNKNDLTDNTYHYEGEQDDDDFEKVYVKTFDLSLRKFISSVNGNALETSREPVVDVTSLQNGTDTTAIYNHPKAPISLKVGDKVIYTIRVYNEGEINGYANEVKDYLPPYLEYVENSTINRKYGWSISEDGRIVTTTYLSNNEISAFNGTTLDYEDLQIECKISDNAIPDERITNIAEISEYKYGDTVVSEDIDSESDNIDENLPEDEELPNYKKDDENEPYVPGNEDDDDFEKVYVKEFDLALRKFITQVQDKEITSRIPQVKDENGVILYEHPKDPITVHVRDKVIYTLRIYNEGEIDGYASEISDDIPEYLEYLPEDSTNVEYMWKMYDENGNETESVEEAVKVKTVYLSKENGEDNLIKAYDGQNLYYRDIKIAFKVKDPNSNEYIITNYAQISDDTDENGNEIKDKDSETDKWNDGEDDQDIENIKVEYFDLSILKFVSKVVIQENGIEKITETGYNGHENPEPVVKVELHKKKLDDVVVKFGYGITVTNEGDIPGYATEITDYVPEGLRFEAVDNPEWTDEGNNIISTKQLENTLLQPGESKTIEVILTWINGSENLALKTNIVEISDDKNEYNTPDRDSTPDNKQDGEDDIDLAKVILAITTGAAKTYFTLTLGLLAVVATGVVLIKKFVI